MEKPFIKLVKILGPRSRARRQCYAMITYLRLVHPYRGAERLDFTDMDFLQLLLAILLYLTD